MMCDAMGFSVGTPTFATAALAGNSLGALPTRGSARTQLQFGEVRLNGSQSRSAVGWDQVREASDSEPLMVTTWSGVTVGL